jgi:hypothetical protein
MLQSKLAQLDDRFGNGFRVGRKGDVFFLNGRINDDTREVGFANKLFFDSDSDGLFDE